MDLKNKAPRTDSSSEQVIDYYRKYSQNRNLPKYFSGTSVSYIPEIVTDDKDLVGDPQTIPKIIIDIDDNDNKTISRPSSAMSNRKLEWDNGADIGYSNAQETSFHKSYSLPDIKIIESDVSNEHKIESPNVHIMVVNYDEEESESDVPIEINIQSTTTESNSKPTNPSSSSKSSEESKVDKSPTRYTSTSSEEQEIINFAENLTSLKNKIGLPDAQSTPNYPEEPKIEPEIKPTPARKDVKHKKPRKIEENIELEDKNLIVVDKSLKQTYDSKVFHKVVNLCITKPITVECQPRVSKSHNKITQVIIKYSSVGVQTEQLSKQEVIVTRNRAENTNNQGVAYFEYSKNQKIKSSSVQTDSEIVVSNGDSFEFVKNNEDVYAHKRLTVYSSTTSAETNNHLPLKSSKAEEYIDRDKIVIEDETNRLKRHETKPDLSNVQDDSNSLRESSKECPLARIISANQSDLVVEDLQTNFDLLQKLVKSKKYDRATKRRYIKKIMNKIIELNCREDSASTSSELFYPKKGKDQFVPPVSKIPSSTESSDPKLQGNSLQNNIPWYPIQQGKKSSSRKPNLEIKTFIQEIPPSSINTDREKKQSSKDDYSSQPEIIPIHSKPYHKKHGRFTLTNNELYINHDSLVPENSNFGTASVFAAVKTPFSGSGGEGDKCQTTSSDKSYANWKEDKTASEKLLEEKLKQSKGDYLTQFAKLERQNQLSWIKNEISHLKKLKDLLEVPKSQKIEKIEVANQTHVYSVSKVTDNMNLKRKYVIETDIGATRLGDIDFELEGEVYNVQDAYSNRPTSSRMRGEIEVVSDNSTTNIRVSTRCQRCQRTICTCNLCTGCNKNPCECCQYCKKLNCMCNVCKRCNKDPCGCCQYCRKLVCTCSDCTRCKKHPCVCIDLSYLQDPYKKDSFEAPSSSNSSCNCTKRVLCSRCGNFNSSSSCDCSRKNSSSEKEHMADDYKVPSPSLDQEYPEKTEYNKPSTSGQQEKIYTGYDSKRPFLTVAMQTDQIYQQNAITQTAESSKTSKTSSNSDNKETEETNEGDNAVDSNKEKDDSYVDNKESYDTYSNSSIVSQISDNDPKTGKVSSSSSSTCVCCKRNISEKIARLSRKTSKACSSLCQQCLRRNPSLKRLTVNHKCTCFSLVKTEMIRQLQKTIDQMNQYYCSCKNPAKSQNLNNCCYCEKKLQKTAQSKCGIAYTLTLEEGKHSITPPKMMQKVIGKLQEIKMKVDTPVSKKMVKEKENKNRQDGRRHSKKSNKKIQVNKEYRTEREEDTNKGGNVNYTLQEYLSQNRPDFISSANYRREAVLNNRLEREKNSDDLKLRFLAERQLPMKQNRLFTEKEMKQITRKNYQKLPEVQNKLSNQKQQQLHQASRLIVDTFNKAIQKNTLKGRKDFPLDVNIVNLF